MTGVRYRGLGPRSADRGLMAQLELGAAMLLVGPRAHSHQRPFKTWQDSHRQSNKIDIEVTNKLL